MPRSGPRTFHGKPVVDATKGFNLFVEAQDCEKGKDGDPQNCAAALALRRRFRQRIVSVHVNRSVTMVETPTRVLRFHTSHGLRDQTLRYDSGRKFEPGHYTLLPLAPSVIKARGQQHSPPDRPHGDPASPKRRSKPASFKRDLGRGSFHYDAQS